MPSELALVLQKFVIVESFRNQDVRVNNPLEVYGSLAAGDAVMSGELFLDNPGSSLLSSL